MIFKKALKICWFSYLTLNLTTALVESFWENIVGLLEITGWILLKNLLVITAVILIAVCLYKLHPFFKWSWFYLFRDKGESGNKEKEMGTNICLLPINIKYFGLVFLGLLVFNLPQFALAEEKWFREGIQNWNEGILWSILFGLTHCLFGVPICAGLAISIAGLWFTHQYFIGGIELSALHHTSYNLILLSALFLFLLIQHYISLKEKKELE